ncbi:5377_t:CDS:2, partial [Paraglomus occultum]
YHLKGKDDLPIIEIDSKIKRASIEIKTMATMNNEAWQRKFSQVLGPLDFLTSSLSQVYEVEAGYCIIHNDDLTIQCAGPYWSASTELTKVLLHIFNEIEKKLIAEPIDMVLTVSEHDDDNDEGSNEGKEGDYRDENDLSNIQQDAMDMDNQSQQQNRHSDSQGNYQFPNYTTNNFKSNDKCYDKDFNKSLKSLPDYSSWLDRIILLIDT